MSRPVKVEQPAGYIPPKPMAKGRPRKNEDPDARFNLRLYMSHHRKGVYTETATTFTGDVCYHCLSCQRDIKFKRTTDIEKLHKHERGKAHTAGLRRMGLADDEAVPAGIVPAEAADAEAGLCLGVRPDDQRCPLRPMKDCIHQWRLAGMPRTVYGQEESNPLLKAVFEVSADSLSIRSADCAKQCSRDQHACEACLKLTKAKEFRTAIAAKCYDMDLCRLAWSALNQSSDELEACKSGIRKRDYMTLNLAGNSFEEIARISSPLALARKVRSRFDAVPLWRKSPEWQTWLASNLTKAPLFHDKDTEAQAHNALCSSLATAVMNGQAKQLDLRLAARVAAGALRTDSLVQALTTTFLMQTREKLSRPDSSRHIEDMEATSQALAVLGKTKELDALLRAFHVNPRAIPKVLPDAEMFPAAFGSLSSEEQLIGSYSRAASILHAVNSRLHVMVDETVWAASLEQVRHMRGNQDFLVGGPWHRHPSDTEHMLLAETWNGNIPSDQLAKLTLHFCVARRFVDFLTSFCFDL